MRSERREVGSKRLWLGEDEKDRLNSQRRRVGWVRHCAQTLF